MRWDCDSRRKQRNYEYNKRMLNGTHSSFQHTGLHERFAWFPVRIRDGVCIWFEKYYVKLAPYTWCPSLDERLLLGESDTMRNYRMPWRPVKRFTKDEVKPND